jgi:hypothetical protein
MRHAADLTIIPDPIAEAALEANLHWPQTALGIALYAGERAVDMIVRQETQWEDVVFSEVSVKQHASLAQAVHRAHAAFGVNMRHEDDTESTATRTFSDHRLLAVARMFVPPFVRAAADFSAAVYDDIEPTPADTLVFVTDKNTPNADEIMARQYIGADALLKSRARTEQGPSAELLAFQGLWKAAHAELFTRDNSEANQLSLERSRVIKAQQLLVRGSPERLELRQEEIRLNNVFSSRGTDAVHRALPNVSEQTGVHLSQAAGDGFAAAVFGRPAATSTQPTA